MKTRKPMQNMIKSRLVGLPQTLLEICRLTPGNLCLSQSAFRGRGTERWWHWPIINSWCHVVALKGTTRVRIQLRKILVNNLLLHIKPLKNKKSVNGVFLMSKEQITSSNGQCRGIKTCDAIDFIKGKILLDNYEKKN